jgi:hypothetical protein
VSIRKTRFTPPSIPADAAPQSEWDKQALKWPGGDVDVPLAFRSKTRDRIIFRLSLESIF